jgi:hypothetical protein
VDRHGSEKQDNDLRNERNNYCSRGCERINYNRGGEYRNNFNLDATINLRGTIIRKGPIPIITREINALIRTRKMTVENMEETTTTPS